MKKIKFNFPGKFLTPVVAAGLLMASCTSGDTNPPTITTGTGDTSLNVKADTMMTDNTHVANADTVSKVTGSMADTAAKMKDTASMSKTTKKGKKGKVSILPADSKPNTAAMEMDKEGYYANTEVLPAFPGGQKALESFFEKNLQYPEAATENQVEGTVKLIFNVDETGKIYQPAPVGNKLGYGLEEEAIRVFNKMPKWTPGKIKGKNVKTRFTLPISFRLE